MSHVAPPLESAKFSYVENQSQHGCMWHVAPQVITVWYFQAMAAWFYESCYSAP